MAGATGVGRFVGGCFAGGARQGAKIGGRTRSECALRVGRSAAMGVGRGALRCSGRHLLQFVSPAQRGAMFASIKRSLKPGGLLLLQGYTPRQLEYRTGGPSQVENLYTEALLREIFADMDILHLAEHDSHISEGAGHSGMSALIDLVARKKPQVSSIRG